MMLLVTIKKTLNGKYLQLNVNLIENVPLFLLNFKANPSQLYITYFY